jgi:hypothetical protein
MRRVTAAAVFAALIATVIAANWLVQHVGFVSVGFGLVAPAGVYAAGLAFVFRDVLHELAGRRWVALAVLAGAAVSWLISPALAAASAIAFLASEAADWAAYEPLRRWRWWGAVTGSNVVGLCVDSVVFLAIAFGSLQFFWGQAIGKAWMTLAALAVLIVVRRRVFTEAPATVYRNRRRK